RTVGNGPGLGENIDGLRGGDQDAGEKRRAGPTAAGEVVPIGKCRQCIAVARSNVRRIVNYRRWVDRHKETGLSGTVGNGPGLGENIDGLRSGDQVSSEKRGAGTTAVD